MQAPALRGGSRESSGAAVRISICEGPSLHSPAHMFYWAPMEIQRCPSNFSLAMEILQATCYSSLFRPFLASQQLFVFFFFFLNNLQSPHTIRGHWLQVTKNKTHKKQNRTVLKSKESCWLEGPKKGLDPSRGSSSMSLPLHVFFRCVPRSVVGWPTSQVQNGLSSLIPHKHKTNIQERVSSGDTLLRERICLFLQTTFGNCWWVMSPYETVHLWLMTD